MEALRRGVTSEEIAETFKSKTSVSVGFVAIDLSIKYPLWPLLLTRLAGSFAYAFLTLSS